MAVGPAGPRVIVAHGALDGNAVLASGRWYGSASGGRRSVGPVDEAVRGQCFAGAGIPARPRRAEAVEEGLHLEAVVRDRLGEHLGHGQPAGPFGQLTGDL